MSIAEARNGVVRTQFGTPILAMTWPDCDALNRQLSGLVFDLEDSKSSVRQSNRGGWQSEKNLQTVQHEAIQQLLSWIDIGVYMISSELLGEEVVDQFPEKWRISAWANVNRAGHFNGIHYHVGGFWSGVYYVGLDEAPADGRSSGAIEFRSPHQAAMIARNIRAPAPLQRAFQDRLCLQPEPGLMLIFPSWLEHWVDPYTGKEPRISIAFDASY